MKVDVEGFEIEVLRGCENALQEQRIRLIQLEWNHECLRSLGIDREPVADLLADAWIRTLSSLQIEGDLVPLTNLEFGPDVFAKPSGDPRGHSRFTRRQCERSRWFHCSGSLNRQVADRKCRWSHEARHYSY